MENKIQNAVATQAQQAQQVQVARSQSVSKKTQLVNLIKGSMANEIKNALPSVLTPERFTRMVTSVLSSTPKLLECTQKSFLGAMMQSAQLGLEPNTPLGQAYLIPRRNQGEWQVQFQIGYKGYLDLAYRSGEVSIIQAHTVCENDEFDFCYGLEPKLYHKPARTNRGKPVYYYAMYKMVKGGSGFEVMSYDDMVAFSEREVDVVKRGTMSPWKTHFDEMAKKTVIKHLLKYAPLSSEFVKATVADETIKSSLSENMDDVSDDTIWGEYEEDDPEEETEEAK